MVFLALPSPLKRQGFGAGRSFDNVHWERKNAHLPQRFDPKEGSRVRSNACLERTRIAWNHLLAPVRRYLRFRQERR